jgi:hypothetical protein
LSFDVLAPLGISALQLTKLGSDRPASADTDLSGGSARGWSRRRDQAAGTPPVRELEDSPKINAETRSHNLLEAVLPSHFFFVLLCLNKSGDTLH